MKKIEEIYWLSFFKTNVNFAFAKQLIWTRNPFHMETQCKSKARKKGLQKLSGDEARAISENREAFVYQDIIVQTNCL